MKVVKAIKSICEDGRHIIFWDFDGVNYNQVFNSLLDIQRLYNLSDIWIIKTNNGFNAVCFAKFDINKVYEIKNNTKYDDYYHIIWGYRGCGWCLRLGNDKFVIEKLPSDNLIEGSYSHYAFFNNFFPLLTAENELFDTSDYVTVDSYLSGGV